MCIDVYIQGFQIFQEDLYIYKTGMREARVLAVFT